MGLTVPRLVPVSRKSQGMIWYVNITALVRRWKITGQRTLCIWKKYITLQWRHNDHDCVSNHQPRGCLLNRLFKRRSKKTSKLRVTGLCVENSPGPVNSPHKGPVTRKMFPFDDVIMTNLNSFCNFPSRPYTLAYRHFKSKHEGWLEMSGDTGYFYQPINQKLHLHKNNGMWLFIHA